MNKLRNLFALALVMLCAMNVSAEKKVLLSANFDDGTNPFFGWGNNSSLVVEDGALKFSNPSVVHRVEVQMAWDFTSGTLFNEEYTLKMRIKGSQPGQISVDLQCTEIGYEVAGEFGTVNFDWEWRDIEINCMSVDYMVEDRLIFNIGEFAGDIYVDDVEFSVKEVEHAPIQWVNILTNSDLEGEDTQSFFSKQNADEADNVEIIDGAGINNSRGIKVSSFAGATENWDSQLFIALPYTLPEGTLYRVKFDYRASAEVTVETNAHATPGNHIHHHMIGNPSFTTEWQTYEYTARLSPAQGGYDTLRFQSIAFNLSINKEQDIDFYFDNLTFEIDSVQVLNDYQTLITAAETLNATTPLVELAEAIATAKELQGTTFNNMAEAYRELTAACQTWHVRFDDINQWNLNTMVRIGDFDVYLDLNSKMASIYRYYGKSAVLEIPETLYYEGDDYLVVGVGGRVNDYSYQAICDSLVSVKLPETLRFIGRSAFSGTALDSLVVPEYVTWIGSSAFSGTSLNELHVKATVPPVCEGDLSPIYIVYVPEGCGNAYWDSDYWKDCAIVPGAGINLFITLQEPGTLGELILQQTEYLRNVNSLKIAGNVNETDMQIIGRLQGLISVDMSELTMKSLPNRLFEGRKALTFVKLPATLESIGENAFRYCSHLYSIELPETLKRIEWNAFEYSSIASIDLPEGLNYLGASAFNNCDKLEEITIPAGVKTIEGSTFWNCDRLKKMVCHEGLERINGSAFGCCYELESVTLPSTLKQCDHAFEQCNNMKQIICYAMLPPACNDKFIVTGPDECALYVPEWTINKYKLAAGWTEFYPIKPIGVLPEDITVYEDFKLTLPDSIPAGYKPNVNIGVGYNEWGMASSGSVKFQLDGKDTLAVKNFQMNYGYNINQSWNGNYYYWDYRYHGSQLLNNVEGLVADSVTLQLTIPTGYWSFVSLPFDVKVSDIVPLHDNTRWIIRRYAGDLRAKQDFANAWQNLTADSILRAGEGYIWHCVNNGIFTLSAMDNATKNHLFATDTLKVAINHYPAEHAHNQGWNLVGNPFPTHFDSRAIDFDAPITVWTGNSYIAYSLEDDEYILKPGEAFFVQCGVEDGQVVFPAEGRQLFDSVRANPSYAPQVVTRAAAPRRVFNLLLNGDAQVDRTRFVINPEAKSSYELNRDASKFMSDNQDAAQLYTIEGEVNYAINERPMGNGEIALGAQFGQRGEYTIALNTNVSDTEVVLVDMLTGVETDLGVSSYTFEAEAGTVTNRFLIKLNAGLGATALYKNLAATTQVTSVNGQVMVRTAEDTEVALYTVDGKLLQKAQGTQTAFQVPAGFYVVKVQNLVYKVAVTK